MTLSLSSSIDVDADDITPFVNDANAEIDELADDVDIRQRAIRRC